MSAQNKIVVGHFLFGFGVGGTESGVAKLVNFSHREQFRHVIITLTEEVDLKDIIEDSSVKLYVLKGKSIPKRIVNLSKLIKKESIDILHARGWPTMVEAAMIKVIRTDLVNIFAFHGRTYDELLGVNYRRRLSQMIFARYFDQIITLTDAMREEIVKEFMIGVHKIRIIPNGIPKSNSRRSNKKQARSELEIDENDFVIGFVGRLDRIKGVETIIEAFDIFYNTQQRGWLVLVGEGESYKELNTKTRSLQSAERIIFTGFREDATGIMQLFDVYVQTSLYEGLSNTILEAMNEGLPIICTNVGGNRDLIEEGRNGYLIDRNDSKRLAECLFKLFTNRDERIEIGKANKKKVGKLYSIEAMVNDYENLYLSLKGLSKYNREPR